jgi:hypothetical protein
MANAGETGMKDRDIVLYVLGRCAERSEFGRTSLQKVMYFVGRRLDRDLGHHAHFYGPFSPSVERETASLVLSKLAEERIQELGFWTSGGFPAKQYEYKLTNLGAARLEDVVARHSGDVKLINEVVDGLLQEAGGLDQRVLSAAAKVDYIAKEEGRPVSVQDVRSAARDLGWTISPTQVSEVVGLLSHLRFVELQKPAKT